MLFAVTMDLAAVEAWLAGNGHLRALLWAEEAGWVQMPDEERQEAERNNRNDMAEIATVCQATGIESPEELTAALDAAESWAVEAFARVWAQIAEMAEDLTFELSGPGLSPEQIEERIGRPYIGAMDAVTFLLVIRSRRGSAALRMLGYRSWVRAGILSAWAHMWGEGPLIAHSVSPFD